MNCAAIYYADIANGPGCRTSLFVSGCTHHCRGCFNEETWDFSYGEPFTRETEEKIIESIRPDYIAGLTVLGGEPMELRNQEALFPFLGKSKKELPEKSIWIYSGYTFEELADPGNERCRGPYTEKILRLADVLVDGEFVLAKKDISLKFRGSSNQRIINLKETFKNGRICLTEYT